MPYDARRGVFTFAAGLEESLPAVVQVTTLGQSRGPSSARNPKPSQGGSGVIIDAREGIIVTNHHVIENGQKFTVDLIDGRLFDATLIGADKATDIAVLKIDAPGLSQVTTVDSDTLRSGDLAFAVGYPLGLDQTLTMGVISGLNRSGMGDAIEDYIQTDAAVNSGNSGGPLLDSRGRLIGINTAILSGGLGGGNDGIAFAVPTRIMMFVVDQLRASGEVKRGRVGLGLGSLTAERAREIGLNIHVESRTGDTKQSKKQRQRDFPPDILLTTPEQLALFCAWEGARDYFADLKCVVLDEVHAIWSGKRGDLLALGLARLQAFAPGMRRGALSATVDDPARIADWLSPSPLGGEGGRRSRSDEGDAERALIVSRFTCEHSPLIRLATRATFSPEGRRKDAGFRRNPHGQFGIIGQHRLDADQDGVMRRAQAVALKARLRPGDPLAFARGRGDAAVQRRGQLQGDAGAHQSWPDLVSSKPSSPRNLAKSLVWRKSL